MTDDLIAFLRARLDEDEQYAREAAVWWGDSDEPGEALHWRRVPCGHIWHDHDSSIADEVLPPHADHIERYDPARVLAEVEAKRRLVELHQPANPDDEPEDGTPGWPDHAWYYCATCGSGEPYTHPTEWPCATLRLIARPYDDHPDYDESWRP